MPYMMIMNGVASESCKDHPVGCGKNWIPLNAQNQEKALIEATQRVIDIFWHEEKINLKSIIVLEVTGSKELDVHSLRSKSVRAKLLEEKKQKTAAERKEFERLRKKFEKEGG